ncbi:unnamed protein product [Oppiella nova]|uniref:C2H2-type domain-containing protein n=1 Tax=Oppiella nova TaxID=334625 RepID=A0A7R9LB68_9ACAR|nr:unnamed protein product [Oppiella nova]CAG2160489.1 unnamed protein product [Oppiella nova]
MDCDKRFTRKSSLIEHKNAVHLKLKPFVCNEVNCGQEFFQKSHLNRHKHGVLLVKHENPIAGLLFVAIYSGKHFGALMVIVTVLGVPNQPLLCAYGSGGWCGLSGGRAHLIGSEPCKVVVSFEVIEGPNTTQEFDCWLKAMHEFRQSERTRINYTDANYKLAELQWAQSSVLQPQMMAHDRDFYDYTTHEYTVDKYANRLKQRYGGIDSVLIWPNYPNIGIDNRNMDDMIRDMPHGIDGLKKMSNSCVVFGPSITSKLTTTLHGSLPIKCAILFLITMSHLDHA